MIGGKGVTLGREAPFSSEPLLRRGSVVGFQQAKLLRLEKEAQCSQENLGIATRHPSVRNVPVLESVTVLGSCNFSTALFAA